MLIISAFCRKFPKQKASVINDVLHLCLWAGEKQHLALRKGSWKNLQNYKDLYGEPLERDWRGKPLLPIQILLIFNVHKKFPLKVYKPENVHVNLF